MSAVPRGPLRSGLRAVGAVALVVALAAGPIALVATLGDPLARARSAWHHFVTLAPEPSSGERFTSSGGARYDLWRVAVDQFRRAPLHGVGAGNYATTYFRDRRQLDTVQHAHSLGLETLGELGLPGALALLAFVGGVLAGAARRRTREPGLVVAGLGLFSVWLVHAGVDWVFQIPGLTGAAILAAATLLAVPVRRHARRPAARSAEERRCAGAWRRHALLGGAVLALAVLAASVGRQYEADLAHRQALSVLTSDPTAALADARRAIALDPAALPPRFTEAAAIARLGQYEQARGALRAAASVEPFNYLPWVLLGDLAVRRRDWGEARRSYARALRLDPLDSGLALLSRHPQAALTS